jgi:hypothetical protein
VVFLQQSPHPVVPSFGMMGMTCFAIPPISVLSPVRAFAFRRATQTDGFFSLIVLKFMAIKN